jgi:hypothetical protein
MTYLKVKWNHAFPDDPIWLYSELDESRWEVRKVEIFADGRMGYADKSGDAEGTGLGEEPIPELEDIAADPQFEPSAISAVEFENVWRAAVG